MSILKYSEHQKGRFEKGAVNAPVLNFRKEGFYSMDINFV